MTQDLSPADHTASRYKEDPAASWAEAFAQMNGTVALIVEGR